MRTLFLNTAGKITLIDEQRQVEVSTAPSVFANDNCVPVGLFLEINLESVWSLLIGDVVALGNNIENTSEGC